MKVIEGIGYREEDIKEELGPVRYEQFRNWARGSTVGISSKGELLTYPWDYENFLAGLPNTD